MNSYTHTDNRYPVGTRITAVERPECYLTIMKYHARIYYCTEVDHPENHSRAYFERELIPPLSL